MGKAPRYNRRIASMLWAQVVGHSLLVSQNDEMTVRALSSCRKIIHRIVAKHNSRVFGSAGDSFMIECTDPILAVECAVEIQAALRQSNNGIPEAQQMWLRVGVNLGDVIEDDGVLHGESINVAVRLQEACPSGGVVVSELIHSRVSGSIDLYQFRTQLNRIGE